jgi:hypothetical protein
MQLKPVAWMYQHKETGTTCFADEQQIEWGFEKNNPRLQRVCALYAIPNAHRIVSAELLERLYSSAFYAEDEALLKAIIVKEPT